MVSGLRRFQLPGCYALMDTRDAALAELGKVFEMIAEEFRHS
jgi:hypothetical protein